MNTGHGKKPDRVARGNDNGSRRHPESIWRGSQCRSSKLTEPQVKEIRRLASSGIDHNELARRFRVNRRNIHYIVARKTWKHVLAAETA
jgi:hypothetical protein